jgi:probable rRNA maturation factor
MDPDISIEDEAWNELSELEALAQKAAKAVLQEAGLETALVSLSFANDATLAQLNGQWRGKPKPTNVLSFPVSQSMPETGLKFLGDVILACGVTRNEAAEQNKNWADHTTHLIIHGILHLAGMDHETESEAAAMEAAEIRAMARLGLGNPYEID